MKQGLLIGELSRQFDIPTQTIRYYERVGLIDPPERTESHYRVYSEPHHHFKIHGDGLLVSLEHRSDGIIPRVHEEALK